MWNSRPNIIEVLAAAQRLVERGVLADQPDPAPHRAGLADDVVAGHRRPARVRPDERREDPHRRRLARPVGAEQAAHGARRDLEVEPVEGRRGRRSASPGPTARIAGCAAVHRRLLLRTQYAICGNGSVRRTRVCNEGIIDDDGDRVLRPRRSAPQPRPAVGRRAQAGARPEARARRRRRSSRAAIELADADGLDGLSMRRVAERLGVGTMSLYTYVPSKAELLDLMLDHVYGDQAAAIRLATTGDADGPGRRRSRSAGATGCGRSRRAPGTCTTATAGSSRWPTRGRCSARTRCGCSTRACASSTGSAWTAGRWSRSSTSSRSTSAVPRAAPWRRCRRRRVTGQTDDEWWLERERILAEKMGDGAAFPTVTRVGEAGGFDVADDAASYTLAFALDDYRYGLEVVLDGIERRIEARVARSHPGPPWIAERSRRASRRHAVRASGRSGTTRRTPEPSRDSPRYARAAMARIDLRSDTVTHPTDAMRRAMAAARARRRRVRRRPHDQRPRGPRRRAARQGGRAVRRERHDGQPRLPHGPPAARLRGDRRRETHTLMDEAGGHAVVVGRHDPRPPGAPRRDDGPAGDRRRVARPGRPPRAADRPRRARETHAHSRRPAAAARLRADDRRDRARARRPAPHRRRPVLQRGGRARRHARGARRARRLASRSACPRASRRRSGRVVVGSGAVHRPGAPRAQAPRRRHAPGRRPGRGRPRRAGRRPGRQAASIERLAEDHANARRLAEGLAELDGVRSPGGIAQPDADGDRSTRTRDRDQLRPVPRRPRPGRRSSPPSRRGACCWSRTRTARSAPSPTTGSPPTTSTP